MSNKSKGTDYEKYVERICKAINSYYDFELIELKQNKKIIGQTTKVPHQIDIYWEFKYSGKNYKCIFECKDYNRKISIDKVATLDSIVKRDIPNAISFIISTKGFQSGAQNYAKAVDINPLIFRELEDKDWGDSIRGFSLDITSGFIPYVRSGLSLDTDWFENHPCGEIDFKKWRCGILINNETNEMIPVAKFIDNWKKKAAAPKSETIYFKDAYIKYEQDKTYFKINAIALYLPEKELESRTHVDINIDDYLHGIIVDKINGFAAVVTKEGEIKIWPD